MQKAGELMQGGVTMHQPAKLHPSLFLHFQLFHPAEGNYDTPKMKTSWSGFLQGIVFQLGFSTPIFSHKMWWTTYTRCVMQVTELDLIHHRIHFGPRALTYMRAPPLTQW